MAAAAVSTAATEGPLGAQLSELQRRIAQLVAPGAFASRWAEELEAVVRRAEAVTLRDLDAVLYLLAQDAQRNLDAYSSRHALYCGVVVRLACVELGWPEAEATLLMRAALTMNLGMAALQDELNFRERTPTVEQRLAVQQHPQASVALLREAGVDDALWLEVVARHHEELPAEAVPGELEPARRLATLLHRADVFTAKLSARQARGAMPAVEAARSTCLGADGRPDELGAALLKALGIYPPGSYVKLASGEIAVVKRRGSKATEPLVLSLIGRDGRPLNPPLARHTGQPEHAVRSAAWPPAARLLAGSGLR
ncbi:MAG TPA: phosphodiesterase [Methylibium sp.]|uniref:HD-GYP domain-containing protein n=1 Tax=Methylibium sp. TaxID=2067992 RepID=UPI002DBEBDE2|nr:phosphodiesterase [Methylibium sp.]HEU4460644.1 phosphodiesterase [Methylibium sp.]